MAHQHDALSDVLERLNLEVELGFDAEQAATEVQRCLNCDIQTHFTAPLCIECDACADICPTDCIELTGKKHPDPAKKGKIIDTYDINFEICILCDLCTEVCPTEAIVMTNNFELAEYSRDQLFKNLEWLDENDENIREENKV
jgi:formate hydrogenlyase subunit 6/NADH:ubiquinone oxidoreductase subunit I